MRGESNFHAVVGAVIAVSACTGGTTPAPDEQSVVPSTTGQVACETGLSAITSPTPIGDLATIGRPILPEVFIVEDRHVLLANELVFGAMQVPVLRYESIDGANFTGPQKIPDSEAWWSPSVVHHDGAWFLFYRFDGSESGFDHDTVGMATSSDLVNWLDLGTVFDPPNAGFPRYRELWHPRVWHDGTRFHLYVTAIVDGIAEHEDDDDVPTLHSIIHATSNDGLDFAYADTPFAPIECKDHRRGQLFDVAGIVRSACGGNLCTDRLTLMILRWPCGGSWDDRLLEVVTSNDGHTFSEPKTSLPNLTGATSALATNDRLWVFSDVETADRAEDGHVLVTPIALPTPLCGPASGEPLNGTSSAESDDTANIADNAEMFENNWAPGFTVHDCAADASCDQSCSDGERCALVCHGSNCSQTCEPNAECLFHCLGGRCAQVCADGSTCDVQCEGGGCNQTCDASARCTVRCEGGDCTSH